MRLIVFCMALLSASSVLADDLTTLVGRYVYDEYSVTFSNGVVAGFAELGLRDDAEMVILPDGSLVGRMTTTGGEEVVMRGKVCDVVQERGRGSWVEQWPEIGYPVRVEIELTSDGLIQTARFENARDAMLYGSVGRSRLRRVGDVTEADRTAQPTTDQASMPILVCDRVQWGLLRAAGFSEQVQVTPALEALLNRKLALAAEAP